MPLAACSLRCPFAGVGSKRRQRAPPIKLTFRPVNSLLQNVYQVRFSCMRSEPSP